MFKLEDVLVEVVLETFVGKVDAELFEAVVLVILKPENVEHSNGQDLRKTDKHNMKKNLNLRHCAVSEGYKSLSKGDCCPTSFINTLKLI